MTAPIIIGLAGTFASGKDTLAHYLADHYDYVHISTSDMLRQEALKTKGSIERPVLHQVADTLRRTKGGGFLVELAMQTFAVQQRQQGNYNGIVVSGLRSLGEAKAIKAAGGVIVFVDAPIEVRYARMRSRQRDSESMLTLQEFTAQETRELAVEGAGDTGFNILGIKAMADYRLDNSGALEDFIVIAKQQLSL